MPAPAVNVPVDDQTRLPVSVVLVLEAVKFPPATVTSVGSMTVPTCTEPLAAVNAPAPSLNAPVIWILPAPFPVNAPVVLRLRLPFTVVAVLDARKLPADDSTRSPVTVIAPAAPLKLPPLTLRFVGAIAVPTWIVPVPPV